MNSSRAMTGCYGSGTKTASVGRARRPPGGWRPPPNSRARRIRGLGSAAIRKMVARAKKAETVPTRSDLKRASERAAAKSAAKAARAKRTPARRAEEDEDE